MTISLNIRKTRRRSQVSRDLRTLREAIAVQNRALGELTYAAHCGDLSRSGGLPELLASLDGLHAQLDQRRRELAALQGDVVCASCGAVNGKRNFYCGGCGKPLGRP